MPKEPKIKETVECPNCRGTKFHGPTDTVEIVNGSVIVQERTLRCLGCHREYPLDEALTLPTRKVELPA